MNIFLSVLSVFLLVSCSSTPKSAPSSEEMAPKTSQAVLERAERKLESVKPTLLSAVTVSPWLSERSSVARKIKASSSKDFLFAHAEIERLPVADKAPLDFYDYGPLLLVREASTYRAYDLRAQFPSFYWLAAFADQSFERVWGLLEFSLPSKDLRELVVVASLDGGATWALLSKIQRPLSNLALDDFEVLGTTGRIRIRLSDRGSAPRKVFEALSENNGRDWAFSAPLDERSVEAQPLSAGRDGFCEDILPRSGDRIPPGCRIPSKK
jgi:hypothetical protein